jgi:hypothetical protein
VRRGILLALAALVAACSPVAPPGPPLAVAELKYRVFEQVGRPWYCDPDFYPIARADEKEIAVQRFAEVQKDATTYQVILTHLGLAAASTDDQKLAVYREWKQLNALALEPQTDRSYAFRNYRVMGKPGEKTGFLVAGRVSVDGTVVVDSRQEAGPPNCPICLAADVRIATPSGEARVTDLRVGDLVWTLDRSGARVAEPLLDVGAMVAPRGHEVVVLVLEDGRVVRVSPGHPLLDGRRVADLRAGDRLDGATVASVAREPYAGFTHDVLPAGATGAYWANGVLLRSSLTHATLSAE